MEKEKLTAYAKKMLLRGDGFRDIANYLDGQGVDALLKKEIFIELEETEKAMKQAEKPQSGRYRVSIPAIVIGSVFFILTCYLQNAGLITLPWSMIGILLGTVALIHIIMAILNFEEAVKKRCEKRLDNNNIKEPLKRR